MATYQNISFSETLKFQWGFTTEKALGDIERAICDFNDLTASPPDPDTILKVIFPSVLSGTIDIGRNFIISNMGVKSFTIQNTSNTGVVTDLETLVSGEIYCFLLVGKTGTNDDWRRIPWGTGTTEITTIDITNESGALAITGGHVVAPGGEVKIDLSPYLQTLQTIAKAPTDGIVIFGNGVGFGTTQLVGGGTSNILIDNSTGAGGAPTIRTSQSPSFQTVTLPGFRLQNNRIVTSNTNAGDGTLLIDAQETVTINDVVKISHDSPVLNITGTTQINGDLLVTGNLNNSYISRSWIAFTGDGTGFKGENIGSITKNTPGNFTITFDKPMSISNYAVTSPSVVKGVGMSTSVQILAKNKTNIVIECLVEDVPTDPTTEVSFIVLSSN